MKSKYLSPLLIAAGVALAAIQLVKFDHALAVNADWTDGQALSWTVFTPAIDGIIELAVILLLSAGTYVALERIKRRWLRLLVALAIGLAGWLAYFMIQLAIQQHLSHFKGV